MRANIEVNFDAYQSWLTERNGRLVYVYVIVDIGFAKIGIAADVKHRLIDLQIGNPRKLAVAHISGPYPRDLAKRVERLAHKELEQFYASGEWYQCGPNLAIQAVENTGARVRRAGSQ